MINIIKKIISDYAPPIYVAKKKKTEDGVDGRIASYCDRDSLLAEQYKVLRTNLYSLSPQAPLKTIMITSTQSQEGKTITACNLAFTLSLDAEKKIILIDSDLRRPAVHRMFGLQRKPGFSDVLGDKADVRHFLEKPARENLYIIPSGAIAAQPSELLSSTKIRDIIEKLKSKFNYIIFDTPPVINVTDASILGSICDGVILVVRYGVTPKDMIEEAFTMLHHAQAKPKACILTDVSIPPYYYYLSKYKYYYKYRYSYKKKTPESG